MGNYGVSAADVRLVVGIGSSSISDANMNTMITNAESETDRLLNTISTPTRVIERYITPHSPSFIMLRKTPVTKVLNIIVGGTAGTSVEVNETILDGNTGRLTLTNAANKTTFSSDDINGNIIDYNYAKMENSSTETSTTAATGTGNHVAVSVGSTGGLSVDEYVKLESYQDENAETTKLIAVGNGTLGMDLSWVHQNGARVIKQQVPVMVKELVRITAAIMASRNMVGSTYTFATSYQLPEISMTKGVPYPHFEKVYNSLIKQRDYLLNRLRPQSAVA